MKTEQEIIKQLHTLQSVEPSDRLVKRIQLLQHHLPEKRTSSVFPFAVIFSMAMVLIVLLVGSSAMIFTKAQHQQTETHVGNTKMPQSTLTLPTNTAFPQVTLTPMLATPSSTPTPTVAPVLPKKETTFPQEVQSRIQQLENNLHTIFNRNENRFIQLHNTDVKGDSTHNNEGEKNSGDHHEE